MRKLNHLPRSTGLIRGRTGSRPELLTQNSEGTGTGATVIWPEQLRPLEPQRPTKGDHEQTRKSRRGPDRVLGALERCIVTGRRSPAGSLSHWLYHRFATTASRPAGALWLLASLLHLSPLRCACFSSLPPPLFTLRPWLGLVQL